MDTNRKKQLKALGKAEVERRSVALHATFKAANPWPVGSEAWLEHHRRGTERERWLAEELPLLHRAELERMFEVSPHENAGWVPTLGSYVQCLQCGSASPSELPPRMFYQKSCECGNISWHCAGGKNTLTVRQPGSLRAVNLVGRG